MKILYIAPRFHTNQMNVIKGWIEQGNEVVFISYYTAIIEDYTYVKPIVLGFSYFYYPIDYLYVNVLHRNDPANTAFKINHGFPPILKLMNILRKEKPDLVILRDRTLYTIVATALCNLYHYKTVLYNQSPLWDNPPKTDFMHKAVRKLTPALRMTPVIGQKGADKEIEAGAFYVPFTVDPQAGPDKKKYFLYDRLEILSIGKFEPRKHHIMLIDVIKELSPAYPEIHLTIIGEATGRLQKQHYEQVINYIEENELTGKVTVKTNVPRKETDKYFAGTDLFVIPSTREMASISQLEAMSFSIPVICSDQNGAACYIDEGKTGYLFKDSDAVDLRNKIEKMICDKDQILCMGSEAYRQVCEKYTFQNYYAAIMKIIDLKKE